jgi:hypothetical protein
MIGSPSQHVGDEVFEYVLNLIGLNVMVIRATDTRVYKYAYFMYDMSYPTIVLHNTEFHYENVCVLVDSTYQLVFPSTHPFIMLLDTLPSVPAEPRVNDNIQEDEEEEDVEGEEEEDVEGEEEEEDVENNERDDDAEGENEEEEDDDAAEEEDDDAEEEEDDDEEENEEEDDDAEGENEDDDDIDEEEHDDDMTMINKLIIESFDTKQPML